MSSTNRSEARESHVADYYVTPIWQIENFLKAFDEDYEEFSLSNIIVLDPCSGGDDENLMSYPKAITNFYSSLENNIKTIDIREDSLAETKVDYLTYDLGYKPNIIITNPPFNQAIPVIKKALEDVMDGGLVIMLLRLNFFGSNKRFPFFSEFMPESCYVHHKRIGFIPNKNTTDSIEYMHAVWRKGNNPSYTKLKVI